MNVFNTALITFYAFWYFQYLGNNYYLFLPLTPVGPPLTFLQCDLFEFGENVYGDLFKITQLF